MRCYASAIAELLGVALVTFAKNAEVDGNVTQGQRQTDSGFDEVCCFSAAVLTVTARHC